MCSTEEAYFFFFRETSRGYKRKKKSEKKGSRKRHNTEITILNAAVPDVGMKRIGFFALKMHFFFVPHFVHLKGQICA